MIESRAKQFNVRYSSATNEYQRFIRHPNGRLDIHETTKTWKSCAYRWENIFRKEERDWKMVYLARAEDTDRAEIEWKFDFSGQNLKIKDIQLKFETKIYETGEIDVSFFHKGKGIHNISDTRNRNNKILFSSFIVSLVSHRHQVTKHRKC